MKVIKEFIKDQKVLPRGPHWKWPTGQYEGSAYGIIRYKSNHDGDNQWVSVHWIDYKGTILNTHFVYRIGPISFDLIEYED